MFELISLFIVVPILWSFILFLLFRFMSRIRLRRNRLIFPVATVLFISVIGSSITWLFNRDIIAFTFTCPLPTLAIFSLLPIVEMVADWRKKGEEIAVLSVSYTILFLWYHWGSNLGGADSIFLMIFSPLLADIPLPGMMIVILYNYAVLVAIAGLITACPFILMYLFLNRKQNSEHD